MSNHNKIRVTFIEWPPIDWPLGLNLVICSFFDLQVRAINKFSCGWSSGSFLTHVSQKKTILIVIVPYNLPTRPMSERNYSCLWSYFDTNSPTRVGMFSKAIFPAVPRRRNLVKMEENFNVNKMHSWHRRRVSLFVSTHEYFIHGLYQSIALFDVSWQLCPHRKEVLLLESCCFIYI